MTAVIQSSSLLAIKKAGLKTDRGKHESCFSYEIRKTINENQ